MPAVPYRGPAGNFYWYDIVLEQQNRPNISCANFKTSLLTLMSNCGEELFDKLVWELAVDIMEEVGHTIDPTEATLLERREIERRIHPYLEQLPTYQDRLQRVFTREKD